MEGPQVERRLGSFRAAPDAVDLCVPAVRIGLPRASKRVCLDGFWKCP